MHGAGGANLDIVCPSLPTMPPRAMSCSPFNIASTAMKLTYTSNPAASFPQTRRMSIAITWFAIGKTHHAAASPSSAPALTDLVLISLTTKTPRAVAIAIATCSLLLFSFLTRTKSRHHGWWYTEPLQIIFSSVSGRFHSTLADCTATPMLHA